MSCLFLFCSGWLYDCSSKLLIQLFFILKSNTWNYIIHSYHYRTKGESNSENELLFFCTKKYPIRVLIPAPTGSDKGRKQSRNWIAYCLLFILYNCHSIPNNITVITANGNHIMLTIQLNIAVTIDAIKRYFTDFCHRFKSSS